MFSVTEKLMEMQNKIVGVIQDAKKFEEGNNSAGTRVTKTLQEIRSDAKDLRMAIFDMKKKK